MLNEIDKENTLQKQFHKLVNHNLDIYEQFIVTQDTFNSEVDINILKDEQQNDPILKQFIEILVKHNGEVKKVTPDILRELHDLPPHRRKLISQMRLRKGLLWYLFLDTKQKKYNWKLVVPPALRKRILEHYHNLSNIHNGELRMTVMIKRTFYWYKMHADINLFCRTCKTCQMSGNKRKNKRAGLLKLFPARHFNEMVAVDLVGPLPVTISENRYLVTMIDRFTRYCRLIPVNNIKAITVVKAILNEWLYRLGIPKTLLSDRGSQFTGEVMTTISHILGFRKIFTTAYHPQTDGMIERLHRWLKSKLRITASVQNLNFEDGSGNWDDFISVIEFHYNNTKNRMTGFAPYELVFGTDPNDLLAISLKLNRASFDLKDKDTMSYLSKLKDLLENKTLAAHSHQENYDKIRKKYYDKSHKDVKFKLGDIVILYVGDKYIGNKKKLLNLYDGPFIIREKKGNLNYKISRVSNETDLAIVHVSKLEKFHEDPNFYVQRKINIPSDAHQHLMAYKDKQNENHID